jgi:hypothetical protein
MPETPTPPRAFTIEIPSRTILLNANDRMHWRRRNDHTQNLRNIAHQLAIIRRIPKLQRATITGFLDTPDDRRRDPANWHPTLKACIDGIVSAGVLPDDSAKYVTDGGIRLGVRTRVLSFSFEIREEP